MGRYACIDEQSKLRTLRAGCNQKHLPTEKLHHHIRDDYLRHHPSEALSHNQSRTGVRIDQLTGPRAVVILIKSGDRNRSDCAILFSSNSEKLFFSEIAGVTVQRFEQVNGLKEVDECVLWKVECVSDV